MASDVEQVSAELKRVRGIDLSGYRHAMLERRLSARMIRLGTTDFPAYLDRLRTDPTECDRLIDTIGINVSEFFRDPIVFEILAQDVLPDLIERRRRAGTREIRVWSAGCAAGEEAYSIAILLHRALKDEVSAWTTRIFGTDIDLDALAAANAGVYPTAQFENTRLGVLNDYFVPDGEGYKVRPFLRRMVRFSRDDLTSPNSFAPAESVFGTFDLVLCRNVLIYFSREYQPRIVDKLCRSLAAGGCLVLGKAESLSGASEQKLAVIDRRHRIYQKPGTSALQ